MELEKPERGCLRDGGEVTGKESVVDSKGLSCLGFHTWLGRLMQPKKGNWESPGMSHWAVDYHGLV